ncbi:MAG: pyruvate formate lyase-activating protein [Lachnospiraceae bacterium]|nr:pyruvate formate lyase-activating protein [Lachnospiraceae bacterium]
MEGRVHSIETFGLVDGPGVRFIAFLQGCRMRCKYCHNPETWAMEGGEMYTPKALFDKAYRYKPYWMRNGEMNGGITVSGGEPLLQIDFVIEFFKLAKEKGIHTTIDTAGNPFTLEEPFISKFNELMEVTDLFMLDIKDINDEKHKELTKWTNTNILEMAKYLSDHGKAMWIRHVLVPGLTDDEEDLVKTKEFIDSLKTVERVEILPYHTLGLGKWENLKIDYPLKEAVPPTREEVKRAEEILGIKEERLGTADQKPEFDSCRTC